jgi:hypothetical protein
MAPSLFPNLVKYTATVSVSCLFLAGDVFVGNGAIATTFPQASGLPINNRVSQFNPEQVNNPSPSRRAPIITTGTYFRPPSNPDAPSGPRTTTGTRGGSCLNDADAATAFTTLGPQATVGLTTSTRPTFAWYLPNSEDRFSILFRLLVLDEEGIPNLVHQADLDYSEGFVTYQLPAEVPSLELGKEYRWQVIVKCNPNRPSRSLVSELPLRVMPPPTALTQTLATASTPAEEALAYGNEGFWYDALARVIQASDPDEQQIRAGLLKDLAVLESERDESFGKDLIEIAEHTAPATIPLESREATETSPPEN